MIEGRPERPPPRALRENGGLSYLGAKIASQGFILTPDERDGLIKKSKRNAQRIFPYLGGQEVNSSPTQDFDRYVISFGAMPLEEAEAWPDLLAIVREKVKPERDKVRRDAHRKYWWHYGDKRPALYAALAPLSRCLVTACVSKHLVFAFQPTARIFSHKLYAFPLDHYAAFAVLQSCIHEAWTRLLSSTLETRLNYSASDCFDTFPFPAPDPRTKHVALEKAGQDLYEARADYMTLNQVGLTKVYNDLPSHLAELHRAMDAAVLDAYGWADLDPRAPRFNIDVIDRLYALNLTRSARTVAPRSPKP